MHQEHTDKVNQL